MHISEGILPAPVLAAGVAMTAGGTALGLRKIDYEKIPGTGLMAAVFFVASLIHVNLGPASVHLVLNGLAGLLLGWSAFPALLVALALQAVLFFFGGLTTLGINTFNMAAPAVLVGALFRPVVRSRGTLSLPGAIVAGATTFAVLGALSAAIAASWGDLLANKGELSPPLGVIAFAAGAGLILGGAAGPFLRGALAHLASFTVGVASVGLSAICVAVCLALTGEEFTKVAHLIVASHVVIMAVEGVITASCLAFLRKVRPEMLSGRQP